MVLVRAWSQYQSKTVILIDNFSPYCSFSDVTTEAIEFDTLKLLIGFALMFCYTMFMLGKLNAVEHRTYLAMTGEGPRMR